MGQMTTGLNGSTGADGSNGSNGADGSNGASYVGSNGRQINSFANRTINTSNTDLGVTAGQISVSDLTSHTSDDVAMQAYTGSYPGPTSEFVNLTSDNLSIMSTTSGAFIHSGSGNDSITVTSGTNVLDGGGGSNFLTGGTGPDVFYVDVRGATANIWDTISNFHAGNSVTCWGVTPSDFTTTVLDGQGAPGFTGVTIIFSGPGKPAAAVTLAGYTSADLLNGRLDVSYGTTPPTDGIPGANYMQIKGG